MLDVIVVIVVVCVSSCLFVGVSVWLLLFCLNRCWLIVVFSWWMWWLMVVVFMFSVVVV